MSKEHCPHCGTYCTRKSAFCNPPIIPTPTNEERIREEWDKENKHFSPGVWKKLADWWLSKLKEEKQASYLEGIQEGIKTSNSGKRMYEIGREEMAKKYETRMETVWKEMRELFPFTAEFDFLPEREHHKMKGQNEVLLELHERLFETPNPLLIQPITSKPDDMSQEEFDYYENLPDITSDK